MLVARKQLIDPRSQRQLFLMHYRRMCTKPTAKVLFKEPAEENETPKRPVAHYCLKRRPQACRKLEF